MIRGCVIMNIKEEIIRIYKRKVASNPDKIITHMGDCGIYNSHLKICTCGLHHWLRMASEEVVNELYPKLMEEDTNEGFISYLLEEFESDNLYIKEKDTFTKVEKLEPLSRKEIEFILKTKGIKDD